MRFCHTHEARGGISVAKPESGMYAYVCLCLLVPLSIFRRHVDGGGAALASRLTDHAWDNGGRKLAVVTVSVQ
jgi:hypothetical protein